MPTGAPRGRQSNTPLMWQDRTLMLPIELVSAERGARAAAVGVRLFIGWPDATAAGAARPPRGAVWRSQHHCGTTVEVPASTFASPIAAVLATPTGDISVKAAPRQSWGLFAGAPDVGR